MSRDYDLYLKEHRENVAKAFQWFKDNLPEVLNDIPNDVMSHDILLISHDESKEDAVEYYPYDNHFYGTNKSDSTDEEFQYAWLHHIHKNPHHWQYWVLHNDDPNEGIVVLDMPYDYIIEMICDWWSFSFKSNDLTEIFNWYKDHKDYILLSYKTRKMVEHILSEIKDELKSQGVITPSLIWWEKQHGYTSRIEARQSGGKK